MTLTQLINELEQLKAKHGDLRVGSADGSPNEGLTYAIDGAFYVKGNEENYVVITSDIDGEVLDEEVFDD